MTDKARELLERALNNWDHPVSDKFSEIFEEIRAYLAEPEVKQDDEPVATLDHNGNFKLLRMVGVTVGQPINLYEHPAPKQDDEPVAWLIPGGITERKDLAEANGSNAQPLYLHPAPRKPFVRLTDKELENLGGKYVGPMSDGEFHLMVITQNALEEKNK